MNTLIQSASALIVKQATIILHRKFKENDYTQKDVSMVAHIHDELQLEVKPTLADTIGKLAVQSIKDAGTHFNFRCPLDAEYHIGNNWSETH